MAIFGVRPDDTALGKNMYSVIAFATLLARPLILYKWKHASSPTYSRWVRRDASRDTGKEKIHCSVKKHGPPF